MAPNDEAQQLSGDKLLVRLRPGGIEMMVEAPRVMVVGGLVGPDGRVLLQ